MISKEEKDAYLCLEKYGKQLTRQQLKTIKGQIRARDYDGAMNGLSKILERKHL